MYANANCLHPLSRLHAPRARLAQSLLPDLCRRLLPGGAPPGPLILLTITLADLYHAMSAPKHPRCCARAQAPCGKLAIAPSDFGLGETSIALRLHSPLTQNISKAIVKLREVCTLRVTKHMLLQCSLFALRLGTRANPSGDVASMHWLLRWVSSMS